MYISQTLRRALQVNGRGRATGFRERVQTWEAFAARVARLAAGLRALGVRPGDRVAILALNSDRYLEFFFAVSWAGAVFVPINTRLAPPEILYWLNDSGSETLFVDEHFLHVLGDLRGHTAALQRLVFMGEGEAPTGSVHHEQLIARHAPAEDAGRGGDELAGIFYTGGTTGQSKGVMLSHTNLIMNALNVVPSLQLTQQTNWLHSGPMFHIGDGTVTFGVTVVAGAHCFIPRFDVEDSLRTVQQHRATNMILLPTMANMVVNHPNLERFDISTLRGILYGASPMPEAVIRKAMQVMPRVTFFHAYGQTEAAPMLTCLRPEYHTFEGPLAGKAASAGQATLGCEVRIFDEHDQEVPRGTVGEICARGPNVMQGYWNKPELTAAALRGGWLHTGDGGTMDEDGFVYVVDRMKDMIISGGENVYSAEVENVIYQHPAVVECAVIGIPSDKWGEAVHAIVRLRPAAQAGADDLIAHCRRHIAGFKCPRSVTFVTDPLPLSGANKILKTELRKPYWAGRSKNVN